MTLELRWGEPLSADDLEGFPDDGHRYELLDGSLLVTPAPGTSHQRCVVVLAALLEAAAPTGAWAMVAPYEWRLSPATTFQPDVLVAWRDGFTSRRLERAPLLVVEVLSPSTRSIDLVLKRHAFAAAGASWYWVVDPLEPSVTALRLDGDRYIEAAVAVDREALVMDEPFPVTVVPASLLD